jgi:hypothetical protein
MYNKGEMYVIFHRQIVSTQVLHDVYEIVEGYERWVLFFIDFIEIVLATVIKQWEEHI